jgi:putative ABC transport system substrate-binding protein
VGYLNSRSADPIASLLAASRRGLGQTGYAEGRNLAVEYRLAEGRYERLPALRVSRDWGSRNEVSMTGRVAAGWSIVDGVGVAVDRDGS